jgi:hypothetical protein
MAGVFFLTFCQFFCPIFKKCTIVLRNIYFFKILPLATFIEIYRFIDRNFSKKTINFVFIVLSKFFEKDTLYSSGPFHNLLENRPQGPRPSLERSLIKDKVFIIQGVPQDLSTKVSIRSLDWPTVSIEQWALIKHCLWTTKMVRQSKIVDPLYILHENMQF